MKTLSLILSLAISVSVCSAEEMNISFSAVYSEGNVLLTWIHPAAEGIYVVERSKDGQNYIAVSVSEQLANSCETQVRDIDSHPLKGLSFYRIKKETNGKTAYSSVVPVQKIKKHQAPDLLFPAVKKEENLLKKRNKGTTEVVVVENEDGKEMYSKVKFVKTGKKLVAVSLDERLTSGEYLIVAASNNSIYSKKLLIQ
jgi:hypothetical protein